MKKTIFIVGGVLALGAIGYLFLRNKKKQESLLGGTATSETSGTATVGTSTSATNSTSVNSQIPPLSTGGIATTSIQDQQNLDKANSIAEKIRKYQKLSTQRNVIISMWKPSIFKPIKPKNTYPEMIKKLKSELLSLGYKFEGTTSGLFKGILVKI